MADDAVGTPRLAILLAAAMFVFVIDTSLMNDRWSRARTPAGTW
jgi:hypothetical protein